MNRMYLKAKAKAKITTTTTTTAPTTALLLQTVENEAKKKNKKKSIKMEQMFVSAAWLCMTSTFLFYESEFYAFICFFFFFFLSIFLFFGFFIFIAFWEKQLIVWRWRFSTLNVSSITHKQSSYTARTYFYLFILFFPLFRPIIDAIFKRLQ